MNKSLRLYFLGGVGEIGKNMTAIEYGDHIIIVDCGSSFPPEDMPGVDLLIPDISYIIENKHKIKGIVLTHGHEDHIGSMPFLLKELGGTVPVYGSKLTLAFLEHKTEEYKIKKVKSVCVNDGDTVNIGCFNVEFIKVSHSISGAFALSINTPSGIIFHTGDYKIDYTPIDGKMTNLARIAEIGKNRSREFISRKEQNTLLRSNGLIVELVTSLISNAYDAILLVETCLNLFHFNFLLSFLRISDLLFLSIL